MCMCDCTRVRKMLWRSRHVSKWAAPATERRHTRVLFNERRSQQLAGCICANEHAERRSMWWLVLTGTRGVCGGRGRSRVDDALIRRRRFLCAYATQISNYQRAKTIVKWAVRNKWRAAKVSSVYFVFLCFINSVHSRCRFFWHPWCWLCFYLLWLGCLL